MTQSSAMTLLQRNIRLLLEAREMSYREFTARSGIAPASLSRIIHGRENVTIDRAEKIAEALGVSLSDLLNENLDKILMITA